MSPERSVRFAQCLNLTTPTTLEAVYWLGRVTLLSAHDQIPTYDEAFNAYFRGTFGFAPAPADAEDAPASADTSDEPPADHDDSVERSGGSSSSGELSSPDESDADESESYLAIASAEERLRERDFAACSPEELALLRRLVERLPLMPPPRKARRDRRHPSGSTFDIRATLRRAHRTDGEPLQRIHRRRTTRPRRVVLIADVSGSMEPYARIYLHLMRGAVRALGAECFAFATRLTRLTRILAGDSVDAAYARVAQAAPDWSSGTLIGDALTTFLDDHGRRGVARGAVVVIVSDGWDTGDPAVVGAAMSRLARMAHRIIWVNPRSAAVGFQPIVRGMAAAMPYVDTLVSGHSLASLQEVMDAIAAATERRELTNA